MAKTDHYFGVLTAAVGVLVAAGLLVLMVLAVEARPAGAAFPGKNGKIVFTSNRDGNYEIYTMNSDRSGPPSSWNVQRLTNNPAEDTDPAFNPEGTKIAFSSNRDGNSEIYVMNSDGTGLQRVTNDPAGDIQPSFSGPAGGQSRVAFTRTRDTISNPPGTTTTSTGQTPMARDRRSGLPTTLHRTRIPPSLQTATRSPSGANATATARSIPRGWMARACKGSPTTPRPT